MSDKQNDFQYSMTITPTCGNCASFVLQKSNTTVLPFCRKHKQERCELCKEWHPARRAIKVAVTSRMLYLESLSTR